MGLLRLLLALAVIADHTTGILGSRLVTGPVAVQAFYLISGFYMGWILNTKYKDRTWGAFIEQRFWRLIPFYYAVLIVSVAWFAFPMVKGLEANGTLNGWSTEWNRIATSAKFWLMAVQVTPFGQDAVMWLKLSGDPLTLHLTSNSIAQSPATWGFMVNPPAWSLAVELEFYLVAPFLVRRSIRFQAAIVLVTTVLRCVIYFGLGLNFDPWTHRLIFIELGTFLIGSIAYRVYARYEAVLTKQRVLPWLAIGAIFAYSIAYGWMGTQGYRRVGFCILIAGALPTLFAYFRPRRWDTLIGELSYPVYMVHEFVIGTFQKWIGHHVPALLFGLVLAILSIGVALLCLPGLKLLDDWRHKKLEKV